jgi:hypothetical protein
MPLIAEGAKKSGVLWLHLDRPRLAWHVWHAGAIYVVTGGPEQALPGLTGASRVGVTLPSKDNGGELVVFDASVEIVDQASESETVAVLAKERLNSTEGAGLPGRWAADSAVVRLTPLVAD